MIRQFEAKLTGTDTKVDGIATNVNFEGFENAWEFKSIDNEVHLIIGQDDDGNWVQLAGTEPYISAWVDELARQIKSGK
jgi:hypothetical protein